MEGAARAGRLEGVVAPGAGEYSAHARCLACLGRESCEEYLICARGNDEEARGMIARYAGRPEHGYLIFHWACVAGNLRAAQESAEAFAVPRHVVAACSHNTLRGSLAGGHVPVARWLAERYRITPAELGSPALSGEEPHYPPPSRAWVREFLGARAGPLGG